MTAELQRVLEIGIGARRLSDAATLQLNRPRELRGMIEEVTVGRMATKKAGAKKKRATPVPFTLGAVGHFGLAVRKPRKSAKWLGRALGLETQFEFDDGVAVGNDNVTIALHKGEPSPKTLGHMSFHLPTMAALRKALAHLQSVGAELEDPGAEIGPEAPGSPHLGLWFHDLDGYRWELSVQGGGK